MSVKLQPRASKNEIGGPLGDELKIKVTAPPVDAAANEALVKFLAEKLDCPRGLVDAFIECRYTRTGVPFRRCHPRDVISHAIDLMEFENLPLELDEDVLNRAFDTCFTQMTEGQ